MTAHVGKILLSSNHPHYFEIASLNKTYLSPYHLLIYSLYQFEAFEALSLYFGSQQCTIEIFFFNPSTVVGVAEQARIEK